jgi:hypothetical protein
MPGNLNDHFLFNGANSSRCTCTLKDEEHEENLLVSHHQEDFLFCQFV